jgi:hypothetical protein
MVIQANMSQPAWAVCNGDVASVPIPGAVRLMGSGLVELVALKKTHLHRIFHWANPTGKGGVRMRLFRREVPGLKLLKE